MLSYQVDQAISDKKLIPVLDDFRTSPLPVHMVHGGQPILPQKLRAFLDFAEPRLKVGLAGIRQ